MTTTPPPPPSQPPLPDRWNPVDFPVLLEVARRLGEGQSSIDTRRVAPEMGFDDSDVARACFDLAQSGYITGNPIKGWGDSVLFFIVTGLTERGRREVGLWPNQRNASAALVELLTQAADRAEDEDDASALRRAGRLLNGVPSSVVGGVVTALIRHQTGI